MRCYINHILSKLWCEHDHVLAKALFWVSACLFVVVSLYGRRGPGKLCGVSFIRTVLTFMTFSSVQFLSHVQLFVTPWTAACQASLSITNSSSLLKLMSIELVMPSNHLIPQSSPLCDLIDYSIHGILQARILEWIAFPFSKGSSQPRDQTQIAHIAGGFFIS